MTSQPEMDSPQQGPPAPPPASPRVATLIVSIVLLVLLGSGAYTLLKRLQDDRVLAKQTDAESVPTVTIIHPQAEKPDETLVLPATLEAYEESPVFARTNGYLVKWYKDIGSRVDQGDLLANIDTPEIDQELAQARANRQQIQAQLELAKISDERWKNLRKTDSVSQQEADQQASGYQQSLANLAAAEANVRRLEQLESFKNVYAPFVGVITRRDIDTGALIDAGSGGREMFYIARADPLRVFVQVPQAYAPAMKIGVKALITLQEFPGQRFEGAIARTADAIDLAARTLRTEVDVPNKDGRLLPGSFGLVHFVTGLAAGNLTVPVNAMLFRAEGPRVAVVGTDGRAHLRSIMIGRDYGATLEVIGGLAPEDQVINNPADSLEDGQAVHIAAAPAGGSR